MNLRTFVAVTLCALSAFANTAFGQEARSIRLLVGLPSGSATDGAARALADSFKESLRQTVVVDNRPGAGGRLAAELLKHSPADGSTLLVAPMGTTIFFPVIASKLAYDPWIDFIHISQVATLRLAFAIGVGTPAKSMNEYVAWVKANPDKASFGSAGAGTPPHFLGFMLGKAARFELTHVPYKGGPPLVTDILGRHIPAGAGVVTDFAELHHAGKVRILAIGGNLRAAGLPDVPTFKDLGYDIDGMTWTGLHAPAGMPAALVERFASAVAAATRKPEIQGRFLKLGFDPTGTNSEQFMRIMQNDRVKWEPIIRASGFKEE